MSCFEARLRNPHISWVALADDEQLRDPAIAGLIRQCCFGYVDDAMVYTTIGYLIGHAYGMLKLADSEPAVN